MAYQHPGYETPPVVEVVFGLNFRRFDKFRAHHIGLAWEAFGGKSGHFPEFQSAMRLGSFPDVLEASNLPLPRSWFINENDDRLVQIQDNWFLFNWRKRERGDYPRFAPLINEFKQLYETFALFVEEQGLGPIEPDSCELTYVNHIEKGDGWTAPHEISNETCARV